MLVVLGLALLIAVVPVLWWALAPAPGGLEPAVVAEGRAGAAAAAGLAGQAPVGRVGDGAPDLQRALLEMKAVHRLVGPAVEDLGRRLRRISPAGLVERWERKIALAGLQGRWNVASALAVKALLALVGTGFGALLFLDLGGLRGAVLAALLIGMGWIAPDVVVNRRAEERQAQISRKLPDVLDQMSVCVEAGLGFDAALMRASASCGGALGEELGRTLQDIRLGATRSEALRALLERTTVPELRMFTRALIQAEKTGVPIAKVLRTQSEDAREKRRQRAEEKAMKLPVKMIFPLIMFILPSLFVVIMGPAVLRVIQSGAFR
jgi:tight adherence protein C